jgi:thioredoxin reductase
LQSVRVEGAEIKCEVLFVSPPQEQTALVKKLGLALNKEGYVKLNEQRESSVKGIYAAGDLMTSHHGALSAASLGALAAYSINHDLMMPS